MRYADIGEAIAGMLDQTTRGMTDHEYELHIKRIKRYANIIEECEDALTVFNEDEVATGAYTKWATKLAKYRCKLEAELNMGL